jgi:hypothetical protein
MLCEDFIYRHEQQRVPRLIRSLTLTKAHEQILRPDGTIEDVHWCPADVLRDAYKDVFKDVMNHPVGFLESFKTEPPVNQQRSSE